MPTDSHEYYMYIYVAQQVAHNHARLTHTAGIPLTGNNTKAAYRVIVNEDEVIALLEKHNFTVDVVDFAALTHMDQLKRSRWLVLLFL